MALHVQPIACAASHLLMVLDCSVELADRLPLMARQQDGRRQAQVPAVRHLSRVYAC
jgi:hypothetical protein